MATAKRNAKSKTVQAVEVAPRPRIPADPDLRFNFLRSKELDSTMFPFENWDLDEIAAGNVTEHCLHHIDPDGIYLSNFFDHLYWWMTVSEELSECLQGYESKMVDTPERKKFMQRLEQLERAVMTRHTDARLAEPVFQIAYNENAYKPKLALLKAYREFTKFLQDTAVGFWGEERMDWLIRHV